MKPKSITLLLIAVFCSLSFSSCSTSAPLSLFASKTPTPTNTSNPTPTPTSTSTPIPTPTATGGGNGLIYVSYAHNYSTRSEGNRVGFQFECYYAIYDSSGKQQYDLTDCSSGDFAHVQNEINQEVFSYSWKGNTEDDSIDLCIINEECYSSDDLSLTTVINRQAIEKGEHQFYSYWLPGSSKTKVLFLDSYDYARNRVDVYVIDLEAIESRLIIEGADLGYYNIHPNNNVSPDGKWIIYFKSESEKVPFITATDGSSTRPFIELPPYSKLPIWSADSASLYMFSTSDECYHTDLCYHSGKYPQQVIRVDPITLESTLIVEGDSIFGTHGVTPGRDECYYSPAADIIYCGYFMVDMTQSPAVVSPQIHEAFDRQRSLYIDYFPSPDQSKVLYSVRDTSDDPYEGYFLMNVKTGKYKAFDDTFAFVKSWSPDSRLVLAYDLDFEAKGERNLFIIDTENMSIVNTIPQGTDPIDSMIWIP